VHLIWLAIRYDLAAALAVLPLELLSYGITMLGLLPEDPAMDGLSKVETMATPLGKENDPYRAL